MPYFYDITRATTSNGTAGTETTHIRGVTIANQETVGLYGAYAASRFLTAGGGQLRVKTCSVTAATGGTSTTPTPKNIRGSVAAQSTWFNDASGLTEGGTALLRLSVCFPPTRGMGGSLPTAPTAP